MKNMDELRKILSAPLPKEAITQHPTKTYLSSIKSIYVTERFNEAFGVGQWQVKSSIVDLDKSNGMVLMHVTFSVPHENVYYECIAGNDNGGIDKKGFDLGDACKGAITDALSKIGSWLGVGVEVFKGQSNAPKKQQTKEGLESFKTREDDQKQWLNHVDKNTGELTKAFQAAKGYLKQGYTVNDLRNWWKISKEVATILEDEKDN